MIGHYDWPGGREAMYRFGPDNGPVVIATLPLFEEANRTRTFAVTMLRALATHGIASILPDLPGQGESEVATKAVTLRQMRDALSALATQLHKDGRHSYGVGIRSGALMDTTAAHRARWHFSPMDGAELRHELQRQHRLNNDDLPVDSEGFLKVSGNLLSLALLQEFADAAPLPAERTLRLNSDPRPADRKVVAAPLWRRSEPGNNVQLAALLANDIAGWLRHCEG